MYLNAKLVKKRYINDTHSAIFFFDKHFPRKQVVGKVRQNKYKYNKNLPLSAIELLNIDTRVLLLGTLRFDPLL